MTGRVSFAVKSRSVNPYVVKMIKYAQAYHFIFSQSFTLAANLISLLRLRISIREWGQDSVWESCETL